MTVLSALPLAYIIARATWEAGRWMPASKKERGSVHMDQNEHIVLHSSANLQTYIVSREIEMELESGRFTVDRIYEKI